MTEENKASQAVLMLILQFARKPPHMNKGTNGTLINKGNCQREQSQKDGFDMKNTCMINVPAIVIIGLPISKKRHSGAKI